MKDRNENPSPSRFYRDRKNGIICGVCAGLADYFGFNLIAVRAVVLILAIPFTAVIVCGYVLLCLLVPAKPENLYRTSEQEEFWREMKGRPHDSLGRLRHRFRNLERRLQRMEAWVTSKEYEIDRELR